METGAIGARGVNVRRVVVAVGREGNENAIIPNLHMVAKHVPVHLRVHAIATLTSVQVGWTHFGFKSSVIFQKEKNVEFFPPIFFSYIWNVRREYKMLFRQFLSDRAIFCLASKVIPDFIGCPLFLSVIGPKEIAPTGQSDAKLAQNKTFLYFRQFICFYFDLSLALKDIFLSSE